MNATELEGWDRLRHGGLLLDAQRQREVAAHESEPLSSFYERELRKQASAILDGSGDVPAFVAFVLQRICGFSGFESNWLRGTQVPAEWGRVAVTGETVKPRQLWRGPNGAVMPVFLDREKRIGIGRGRRATSQVLQWLRAGDEQLALVTNGRQWRLVFAGLDFDAWCEWDLDLWFEEGELSPQVTTLRTLLAPTLWTPTEKETPAPLLQAVLDSRKGQAELSQVLGERVREAVEVLVQGHGEALKERCADVEPAVIYRAAVRVVMRLVVVLFAESRELLPRDNALYHGSYGLTGLLEELEKIAARGGGRLDRSYNAWPRVLALFRLVHDGSHHPSLPVPAYGGELFALGEPDSPDGFSRALAVFESACFDHEVLPDRDVHSVLERITRTRIKLRQGRSSTWMPAPVDFSDLSSEYIGILYEGLLDFELKTAPASDPVVFLAVGNQPALPLSRLEGMDDTALKNLLENMKDTSSSDDEAAEDVEAAEEETEEEVEGGGMDEEEAEGESDTGDTGEEDEDGDERHSTRIRAEAWARRAVEVGKLARKPSGRLTPERQLVFEAAVARKARQLVARVVLPGEWYLVRWGGTRKGSGTFYTRPGLAVPTVQRTLRPLAWEPPMGEDGAPDRDAQPVRWTPKTPEEILALKVLDPACGSGTFPVATLRFLTDTLYASLHHHGRITEDGDRSVVALLTGPSGEDAPEERLFEELLPCRPDDALFEPRLKAVLRRHVVERCVYGVDLDPLAVELCRLALWIETMDRSLPFSFLDHKVKCGNALAGAWFDQFQHYPVMAWKNREGGDKNHNNGVYFQKDALTKAIKAFVKDELTPDIKRLLEGRTLFDTTDMQEKAGAVHDEALAVLFRLHNLPVQDSAERASLYREELLGSEAYRSLKEAMDLWCACWFWSAQELEHAPLPSTLAHPPEATRAIAVRLAAEKRFFHWELEFSDVFRAADSGFDAVLGNPPWDIAKPNSKEFFSNIDPLYRSYGKQEALRYQTTYFKDETFERSWLDYNAEFRALSNFTKYSANPFGDPDLADKSQNRFSISRGRANTEFHTLWRRERTKSRSYTDSAHPFRHQGSADLNTYKLFLEKSHALLRKGGYSGLLLPASVYSDQGATLLRVHLFQNCDVSTLYVIQNEKRVFPQIHHAFKFAILIFKKGGRTESIRTIFRLGTSDSPEPAEVERDLLMPGKGVIMSADLICALSPSVQAILEIRTEKDLSLLKKIFDHSINLGEKTAWGVKYKGEFHMTNDSRLFSLRPNWEARGYQPDQYGRWLDSRNHMVLPLFEGRMIGQFDCFEKGWVSGAGRTAIWRNIPWGDKTFEPQFLIASENLRYDPTEPARVTFINATSATNTRTMIATPLTYFPCGNSAPVLEIPHSCQSAFSLAAILNSYVYDWVIRQKCAGLSLNWFILEETPVPRPEACLSLGHLALRLSMGHEVFAPEWLRWQSKMDWTGIPWRKLWAVTTAERLRLRCIVDAISTRLYGLDQYNLTWILRDCDRPAEHFQDPNIKKSLDPKGFWRANQKQPPELRNQVLTLVCVEDLICEEDVNENGPILNCLNFLEKNNGEGWMLPETLRLADYGLGHDDRAKEHQPVTSRLGPRFYDWQLEQDAEESWRECHLHARNLLGEAGYQQLLDDIEGEKRGQQKSSMDPVDSPGLNELGLPLFDRG